MCMFLILLNPYSQGHFPCCGEENERSYDCVSDNDHCEYGLFIFKKVSVKGFAHIPFRLVSLCLPLEGLGEFTEVEKTQWMFQLILQSLEKLPLQLSVPVSR